MDSNLCAALLQTLRQGHVVTVGQLTALAAVDHSTWGGRALKIDEERVREALDSLVETRRVVRDGVYFKFREGKE